MNEKPKRTRVDVRSNCRFERIADGTWTADFDYLGVHTSGASEEDAWESLQQAIGEAIRSSPENGAKWEQYVKEFGFEEEIPEEELRERQAIIDASHAASAGFRVLDAESFADAISSETPVLVDFWAEWCMPCHMLAPVLKEVAVELGDRLEVTKLNMDDNKEFWERLSIEGIPTMILFSRGEEKFRLVGAGRTKEQMLVELQPHLKAVE